MLNVKDFGVVGDGVVNDRDAFQDALDAAAILPGALWIPAGTTIRTTSPVTAGAIAIHGENRNTSRIFVDHDGVGLTADADSLSTFEARNLTFTGELTFTWTLPTRTNQVGLKITSTPNAAVANCVFVHCYGGLQLIGEMLPKIRTGV